MGFWNALERQQTCVHSFLVAILTEGRCGAGGAAPRRKVKWVTSTGHGHNAQEKIGSHFCSRHAAVSAWDSPENNSSVELLSVMRPQIQH